MWMLRSIELNLSSIFKLEGDVAVWTNFLDSSQFAIGNAELLVGRGELNTVDVAPSMQIFSSALLPKPPFVKFELPITQQKPSPFSFCASSALVSLRTHSGHTQPSSTDFSRRMGFIARFLTRYPPSPPGPAG